MVTEFAKSTNIAIRLLTDDDSLRDLTDLLHRAYAPLGARGLNYTAVDQPIEETSRRIARGECAIALRANLIIGTVLVRGGPNLQSTSAWYQRRQVEVRTIGRGARTSRVRRRIGFDGVGRRVGEIEGLC